MFLHCGLTADLGGLPTGGLGTLLLLVLLGSLTDVGVVDQAAEQRGNLWPDVQLLLKKEKRNRLNEFTQFSISSDKLLLK